jgi:hypothetical protein
MIGLAEWTEWRLWITFLVGHRYVNVFADRQNCHDVFNAVTEFVAEADADDGFEDTIIKPFVVLTTTPARKDDLAILFENEVFDLILD